MCPAGQDPEQICIHEILMHLRDAQVTVDDSKNLVTQTLTHVQDVSVFSNALHLYPTVEAVVEYNVSQLRTSCKPIATIKAVDTGPNSSKAPADDANGLEAMTCLAHSARVMLISNPWTDVGLVNGAMGTIEAICYRSGGPPHLPVAVMVRFDHYIGPTLHNGTVPIPPICQTWSASGSQHSRLQLPLKLAWAVTIHKSQGLTLDKVVIDIGQREFSSGLTFVACSRVCHLQDLLFNSPFPYQRLANLSNSRHLVERKQDLRLLTVTLKHQQRPYILHLTTSATHHSCSLLHSCPPPLHPFHTLLHPSTSLSTAAAYHLSTNHTPTLPTSLHYSYPDLLSTMACDTLSTTAIRLLCSTAPLHHSTATHLLSTTATHFSTMATHSYCTALAPLLS